MAILAKQIITITKPYWPRISAGIAVSLVVSGITGAIAWSIKPAIDFIFVKKQYENLKYLLPIGIFLLFAVRGFLIFAQTYLMKSAAMKLVRGMRNRLYQHILHLPVSYFNKEASGVITSRIMYDVKELNGLVSGVLKTLIVEVPTVIFLLGVAFYRSWNLTLASLILLPVVAYSSRKLGKRLKKKTRQAQRKVAFLTHKIGEAILGNRVIKIFNREGDMEKKFLIENQQFYREVLRAIRLKEFAAVVIDAVTGAGIAFVLWYGITMIVNGTITAGDFATILVAIYMIFSPLKKIGDAYTTLQEIKASIARIDTLLAVSHEEQGEAKLTGFREAIKFDHVTFAYPGTSTPVLKDINLEVKRGEIVAIVGQSGVGKSTLIDLIPKFNKPSSGKLTIDGQDITVIDIHTLRELIGIVSQDVVLFNDTVKANIAFGRKGATDDEIFEAARLAYADDFIKELPEKYDSIIGERGLMLSGGQRQRLAIARAVLKNSPILILDEATSALDSVSEALVQKALEKLMKGRTTLVIAHRLSTIKNADRIIVLEKNKIVDIGTHEHLITTSDTYVKLYKAFVPL